MRGCRGHNCDAEDREIHEAIPDVMAVLHANPDLQQGLLDAAADTTSAAVVAPLTFGTYFSLAGTADHEVDSPQVSHRHQNITSYFSDGKMMTHLHQGARKWYKIRETTKIKITRKMIEKTIFPSILSSYRRSLTQGSSYVTKQRNISNRLQRNLVVTNPLTGSTQLATSFGPYTIPPKNLLQGFEVRSAGHFEKSKIQRTRLNG
jgi:hypothetical protein